MPSASSFNSLPFITGIPSSWPTLPAGVATDMPDIGVTDPDDDVITVTLSPYNGTIGGVTDADPARDGVQIVGTPAVVTDLLKGLTFTASDATFGMAWISIEASDGQVSWYDNLNVYVTEGPGGGEGGEGGNHAPSVSTPIIFPYTAVRVGEAGPVDDVTITDPDGDPLTVTLTSYNGQVGGVADEDPLRAGLQLSGTAAELTAKLADLTFTAGNDDALAWIEVRVSDGQATGTGTIMLSVTGRNGAPAFSGLNDASSPAVIEPRLWADLPDFTVSDAEGDVLTLSLFAGVIDLQGVTDDDAAADGVQLIGTADQINARLAAIDIKLDEPRDDFISMSLTDGHQALPVWGSLWIKAWSDNADPTLAGIDLSDVNVRKGVASALPDFTVADADGDVLTLTLSDYSGTIGGAVDADPDEAGFQLVGTPDALNTVIAGLTFTASRTGIMTIRVSVSDGRVPDQAFTWMNVFATANKSPAFSGLPATTLQGAPGELLELPNVTVADGDGDPLTVTVLAENGVVGGLTDADPAAAGIQLVGTAAQISAALAAATFTPDAAGPAKVILRADDGLVTTPVERTINIQAEPPAPPGAPTLALDAGSDTGAAGDRLTADATPKLTGEAEAGALVRIYGGAVLLGVATANDAGQWSWTPEGPLPDGAHVLTAVAVSDSGESAASTPLALSIDTDAPAVSVSAGTTALASGQTTTLTFTFDEAPVGFDAADVAVSGGTILGFTATDDPKVFTATFRPADGATSAAVTVAGAGYVDAAGNAGADGRIDLTIAKPADPDPEPPPPPPPAEPPRTVDGVPVTTTTTTHPDGSRTETLSIPVVTPGRVEQVGGAGVADIPLAAPSAGGETPLLAQLPVGYGLQVAGPSTAGTAGNSLTDLIREIQGRTLAGSTDQTLLTGGGAGFLGALAADTPLLIRTLTPVVGVEGAPAAPLVLQGPQLPDAPTTALVIDTRSVPFGASIVLENVEFAAIVGAAHVTGGDGAQTVWGDGAAQYIVLGADDDVLHGGAGDDTVGSATGNDTVQGGEGQDVVFGGEGEDFVHGNTGRDTVNGGAGDDRVYGGQGDDRVFGDEGSDLVFGDLGDDFLHGGAGADLVDGGLGNDTLHGGQGGDALSGGDGDDALNGDLGDDAVHGGLGNDLLYGYDGGDSLRGGQGDDILRGDAGDDWLAGDLGADTLFGGAGADVFLAAGSGQDVVMDFDFAEGDRVRLLAGATYSVSQAGADTVIALADGGRMVLAGVQLAGLGEGWIVAG